HEHSLTPVSQLFVKRYSYTCKPTRFREVVMVERPALNRTRVIGAAVGVADRAGLAGVSMRNVGRELGVEAMSLYHHVAGKEDLLDAMADWIFARIELPEPDRPWRQVVADRSASARRVLSRHPWALGLLESR